MITFENTQVVGWEPAIRGMRNPMNSWEKSDTSFYDAETSWGITDHNNHYPIEGNDPCVDLTIGNADHDLMMRLAAGGPVHAKYRRMINVYVDITAPLYWWKEFDTYKVGTVANSCSTMHKIQAKKFELDDFSHEHLTGEGIRYLEDLCALLNFNRIKFLEAKDKDHWWQMIQLLPSSYNQKRTVMMNYEVLHNIYVSRKEHKLDEWREGFIDWIKSLPYSELITGEQQNVTWHDVIEDFKMRYPEYFKHFVDYRPTNEPFIVQIRLNVTNAVTGSDTIMYIMYDYTTKKISSC